MRNFLCALLGLWISKTIEACTAAIPVEKRKKFTQKQ